MEQLSIFIETAGKLKPKAVIMENVEGLLVGNAWAYVQKIYQSFKEVGYKVKHWLLKGEKMGVPQTRHRVFFVAVRNDIDFDLEKIDMFFNYEAVTYSDIKEGEMKAIGENTLYYDIARQAEPNDCCIADTRKRLDGKNTGFQTYYVRPKTIIPTLRGKPWIIDIDELSYISKETIRNAQTFPRDYNFLSNSYSTVGYVCGMSVPPIMIKRIVLRLIESGIFKD